MLGLNEQHKILKKGEINMPMKLKAARTNAGYDQKSAAKMLGVSPDTLGNWEKGTTFPNVPQILKIEELYSVSFADITFIPKCSV